ncbi:MAG: hypothetical protein V8T36_03245 [Ruthenibacterium lactatiformans]
MAQRPCRRRSICGTAAELLECGAPAGSLLPGPAAELGLPPNIPVVAGAMDQTAAALAAGCTRPGTVAEPRVRRW